MSALHTSLPDVSTRSGRIGTLTAGIRLLLQNGFTNPFHPDIATLGSHYAPLGAALARIQPHSHRANQLHRLLQDELQADLTAQLNSLSSSQLPQDIFTHRRQQLWTWAARWAPSRRRIGLTGLRIQDVTFKAPQDVSCALCSHWAPVFTATPVDLDAARRFLDAHARHLPTPSAALFRADDLGWATLLRALPNSAPGPDGIPYAALRNAPANLREAISSIYTS